MVDSHHGGDNVNSTGNKASVEASNTLSFEQRAESSNGLALFGLDDHDASDFKGVRNEGSSESVKAHKPFIFAAHFFGGKGQRHGKVAENVGHDTESGQLHHSGRAREHLGVGNGVFDSLGADNLAAGLHDGKEIEGGSAEDHRNDGEAEL